MSLRALVIDDEALARSRLRTLLGDCTAPTVSQIIEAANATQAIEALRRQSFDVALLDIHMPGADGLTLARLLRDMEQAPVVVFVTAHSDYAVQAFELDAVDYLTKPVRLERLQAALQKVERTMSVIRRPDANLNDEVVIIQERGRTLRLPLAEVLYFKAELKYITVRTPQKSYLLDGSLSELEDKYAQQFMRIHRNALIARRAVRALEKYRDPEEGEGWAVRLEGIEELLFVSRRQVAAVREAISA
jgi:two-component system, LytTR family, response regulator AlgR